MLIRDARQLFWHTCPGSPLHQGRKGPGWDHNELKEAPATSGAHLWSIFCGLFIRCNVNPLVSIGFLVFDAIDFFDRIIIHDLDDLKPSGIYGFLSGDLQIIPNNLLVNLDLP